MKDFDTIYENLCKKHKDNLLFEIYRKKSKSEESISNLLITIAIFSFAITGILSFSTFSALSIFIGFFSFILLFIGIISNFYFTKNRNKYANFFKENIISDFIKEYSEALEFDANKRVSPELYNKGEFETDYDKYYGEDLIYGTLDEKYKIYMSEVHTQDVSTDSDGCTSYYTLFHGLFAGITFNKNVNTTLKIRRNTFSLTRKTDKVEMDSSEFEKCFDVYSKDNIIAMQLLTSDIMQILLDFKTSTSLTPELTLKNHSLYIRFDTGDIFEPNQFKASLDYDILKRYYDTINFILDICKHFVKNVEVTEI